VKIRRVSALRQAMRALGPTVRDRPSFALYLAALAALPFAGIVPIGVLSEHSSWTDVLVGAAAVAWILEMGRAPRKHRAGPLRAVYIAFGAFLASTALSALLAAPDHRDAAVDVLLSAELVVLALLTADYARSRKRLNAIVLVIALGAIATILLAALGVALFYLGFDTSLTGVYGEQFIASNSYVRAAAGFDSPPLLANYCIVAAAVMAIESDVSPRLRRGTELALGIVVVFTLSRGILGFFVAMAIREAGRRRTTVAKALAGAATLAAVATMVALSVGQLHLDPTRPSTISYHVPDPGNRREAFATSLDTLWAHPVLGSGPGTLPGFNRGVPFRAHFTPLNVAATVGLPALIALATGLALLWTRRPRPTDIALWSGFAGIAIDAIGQDIEHFRHVWILIGLAAAGAVSRAADGSSDQPSGTDIARPPCSAPPDSLSAT
jgi:hypothetical protein